MSGYSLDEARGRRLSDLGAWTDDADRLKFIAAMRECGRVQDFEVRMRNRAGDTLDCVASAECIGVGGEQLQVTIVHDITQRKRAEAALRESEVKFRTLFESAGDAIFIMRDDLCIDCNARTLTMF